MRKLAMVIAAMLLIATVATLVSASGQPQITDPVTIKVIEHATTDKVIDVGKKGDSTGDLLTFHNAVYNAANKAKIGRDQGVCVRIDKQDGSWECRWITFLQEGRHHGRGTVLRRQGHDPGDHRRPRELPQRARHDGHPVSPRRRRVRLHVPYRAVIRPGVPAG